MPIEMNKVGKQKRDHKDRVKCSIKNAQIMGEFLNLDFKTFDAFYSVVTLYLPELKTAHGKIIIRQFWDIRNRRSDINDLLEKVVEKLKLFKPLML